MESDLRGASPVEGDLTEQRCARFDLQRRHCRSEQGDRVGRFRVTVSRDRRLVRRVRARRECSLPSPGAAAFVRVYDERLNLAFSSATTTFHR